MKEFNSSSETTSKFNMVADENAFRTNLLALNAAVEAAWTGEPGMVLPVVAEELRSLTDRNAQAARGNGTGRSPAPLAAVSSYSADISALGRSLDNAGRAKVLAPVAAASLSHGRDSFPMDDAESNF